LSNLQAMSISAGLLVIIIVLIRAVALNKLPKTAFVALWGVVLFRLLVPVTIPVPFSLHPYHSTERFSDRFLPYPPSLMLRQLELYNR